MGRKNLNKALDFNRLSQSLVDLNDTQQITEDDVFLVLDLNETQALAQPKQISLSGIQNSLNQLPVFVTAVSGIASTVASSGYVGATGPIGVTGATGPVGVTGVTGSTGATGAVGPSGAEAPRYLLNAFDTTVQTNTTVSGNAFTYNTIADSRGITVVSGSMIRVAQSGVYDLQFSAQLEKTGANKENVEIWFRKNGVDIPWSNTTVVVEGSSDKQVASWNIFMSMDTNEYAQIMWYTSDPAVKVVAVSGLTNPVRPNIPSIIVTVDSVY